MSDSKVISDDFGENGSDHFHILILILQPNRDAEQSGIIEFLVLECENVSLCTFPTFVGGRVCNFGYIVEELLIFINVFDENFRKTVHRRLWVKPDGRGQWMTVKSEDFFRSLRFCSFYETTKMSFYDLRFRSKQFPDGSLKNISSWYFFLIF